MIAEHGVGDGHPATEVPIGHVTDIAVDAAGNIYFVDAVHSRVRRINPDGIVETVFNGYTLEVPANPRAIAIDAENSILYVADDGSNRVWVIRDGKVEVFAGTGNYGLGGDGGPAIQAELRLPADIALGPDGSLYIADLINHRIRAVAMDGSIDTVAGDLPPNVDVSDALASDSLFQPELIAAASDGWLYVVDRQGRRLQRILPNGPAEEIASPGATISSLAATADGRLLFASAGQVVEIRDGALVGFTEGDRSLMVVAPFGPDAAVGYDGRGHRLYLVQRNGAEHLLAGNGTESGFGDGGPANGASFTCYDVAVTSEGEILFSDPSNRRIAIIHEDGTIATLAGGEDPDVPGALASPLGMASDGSGAVYVADRGTHRIVKVSADGSTTTVAGNGVAGLGGDGGPATEASLDSPLDVAVASDGVIFIADSGNRSVRRVDSGIISTVAILDTRPRSITIGADGNLVVAGLADEPLIVVPQSNRWSWRAAHGKPKAPAVPRSRLR